MIISLSVIVPTRNSFPTLERLAQSVEKQLRPFDELIIVDGQSADGTADLARRLGLTVVSYPCSRDMRGFARNLGASRSVGRGLLFLDSDMELAPGVIDEVRSWIAAGFDAVTIPEKNVGSGLLGRVRAWERGVTGSHLELTFSRGLSRHLFERTGGFDERIIGFEDLDLQASILESHARIAHATSQIIHHEEALGLLSYVRKRRRYERTVRFFKTKHPLIAGIVFSPVIRLRVWAKGIHKLSDVFYFVLALLLRLVELA